jgi:hypothetical protein
VTGYNIVNLADVLKIRDEVSQLTTEEEKKIAERVVESINGFVSAFSCPQNQDVEMFLRQKAVTFAEQGIAATYLVFTSYQDTPVLVGYFTLANKYLSISDRVIDSKALRRKIDKYAERNEDMKAYHMAIPLIAQLGKIFLEGYNKLITGDELLKLACDKIAQIQIMLSGKMTYVECEDKKFLIDFYMSHGFRSIGNRTLTKAEKKENDPDYLVQLIKYIKR